MAAPGFRAATPASRQPCRSASGRATATSRDTIPPSVSKALFAGIWSQMAIEACILSPRHGAFAPACVLFLEAARGVTIAVVSSRKREWRQPGLATDDPAFVGWPQSVRGIEGSQVHFDFVCSACENGRAATGTEIPPGIVACFAIDRHRILREHRGCVKKGSMMLAAVETVTKAHPVRKSRSHNSNIAAQATARESVHAASPPVAFIADLILDRSV